MHGRHTHRQSSSPDIAPPGPMERGPDDHSPVAVPSFPPCPQRSCRITGGAAPRPTQQSDGVRGGCRQGETSRPMSPAAPVMAVEPDRAQRLRACEPQARGAERVGAPRHPVAGRSGRGPPPNVTRGWRQDPVVLRKLLSEKAQLVAARSEGGRAPPAEGAGRHGRRPSRGRLRRRRIRTPGGARTGGWRRAASPLRGPSPPPEWRHPGSRGTGRP